MALHPQVQAEYFQWILNCVEDPFRHIPMFCDWLDEQGIHSQQWREIRPMLPNVKYYSNHVSKYMSYCHLVTKHKCIFILFSQYSKKIQILIRKRQAYQTNANLQKTYKAVV